MRTRGLPVVRVDKRPSTICQSPNDRGGRDEDVGEAGAARSPVSGAEVGQSHTDGTGGSPPQQGSEIPELRDPAIEIAGLRSMGVGEKGETAGHQRRGQQGDVPSPAAAEEVGQEGREQAGGSKAPDQEQKPGDE